MTESLHEYCGVFGIYNHPRAADSTFLGLYALQHRGQESAGIVSTNGEKFYERRGMGLVSQVFDEDNLRRLEGTLAMGHNRYSTTGQARVANIQPLTVKTKAGVIGLAHNGNLVNAIELRKNMEQSGSIFATTADSEVILHLIARSRKSRLEDMIIDAVTQVEGAYSLLLMTKDRLIGVRDPFGFRPLCLGRLGNSTIMTSETCALDILGAEYIRDVEPGELVVVDERGITSITAEESTDQAKCIFEFIYFSRPDSKIFGENVDKIRRKLGVALARNHPVDADVVIAVPDSSNTSTLGFARESGIPFELGLIRNHYVGRTFIQPDQSQRDGDVRVKFNPVRGILEGKRVAVVDDSIVRGSTMKKLVKMLRHAGVKEVHLRISSPPVQYPCFYGIDIPERSELVASSHSIDQIREYLNVDSLEYLTMDDLRSVVDDPDHFCYACFSGDYKVPLSTAFRKSVFEDSFVES
ncbi:MAG: amidophosphoribosyltransferase [bacterium]|nr:amidophosphoribosyltransferase [bacterium]